VVQITNKAWAYGLVSTATEIVPIKLIGNKTCAFINYIQYSSGRISAKPTIRDLFFLYDEIQKENKRHAASQN